MAVYVGKTNSCVARRADRGVRAGHVVCGQVRSGLVWGFSCQAVVLGCADSFLFGAGKAVFRPVACNQVPGARGRGQGTETLASLVFRSALTPEHAEGRWTGRRAFLRSSSV